ncbi:semaphorin-4C isoform X3 [Vulpes lagopus]|uniref:semaphorin-4C isoform X3 n=1 Tax=Vulpes lagopus TaxID=494514 RepID=UPI001BC94A74|nr:semaphorin-4C isoform X3 [Vulpes lagopus]
MLQGLASGESRRLLGRPDQVFCTVSTPPASRHGLVWAPFRSVFSGCDSDPFFSPSRAAGLELRAEAFAMAPHWAVWLLAVGLWGLGIGAEMWWNLVPRKTVSSGELATVVRRFSQSGTQDFLTLTLTEQTGLLYVGAREALFVFSVEALELQGAISWEAPAEKKAECIQKGKSNQTECFNFIRFLQPYNTSHLYVCGTYAFQPKCTYIDMLTFTLERGEFEDGKGKCPYDPAKGHTGLLVDGELYSATLNNFLGTEPVILRNMGPHHSMKTEYLAFWLNEPHFVGSAYIPESVGSFTGDDDKIYFFFSERAVEYDCYAEQVVARVARVCKGDMGGARTLQRKWTTFLKARLVCSAPDWQLYFNQLQALHTLQEASWHNTTFFGVFRARWGDVDMSAVCEYQLEEIQRVFEGPYKEYREQAQKWGRYTDPVPSPRPGSCINNWHRRHGYTSSLELPDNTLNFIKKHPLMEEQVGPRWNRPLLVKKDTNFTHLVADRVTGLDGATYTVLFIGTGGGWLLKAVSLGSWVHLIEEMQVFDQEPVESLVLSRSKKLLFAGSRSQLVQLPLADCVKYRSCADCVLARDPYCAWSVNASRCIAVGGHSGSLLIQHVAVSDTSGICNLRGNKKGSHPKTSPWWQAQTWCCPAASPPTWLMPAGPLGAETCLWNSPAPSSMTPACRPWS